MRPRATVRGIALPLLGSTICTSEHRLTSAGFYSSFDVEERGGKIFTTFGRRIFWSTFLGARVRGRGCRLDCGGRSVDGVGGRETSGRGDSTGGRWQNPPARGKSGVRVEFAENAGCRQRLFLGGQIWKREY